MFLLVLMPYSYALNQNQTDLLNNISSQLNISNTSLIDLFVSLEDQNFQTENNTYNKSYIDSMLFNRSQVNENITQLQNNINALNNSINSTFYSTLEDYKTESAHIAELTVNTSIDGKLGNQFENMKTYFISRNEFDELQLNQTNFIQASRNTDIFNIRNETFGWIKGVDDKSTAFFLISLFIDVGIFVFFYFIFRKRKTETSINFNPLNKPFKKTPIQRHNIDDAMYSEENEEKLKKLERLDNYILFDKKHKKIPNYIKSEILDKINNAEIENESEIDSAVKLLQAKHAVRKGVRDEKK